SIVVISCPSASRNGNEHERTGSPSTWTVHAPQRAIPQPNLVPVSSSCSRSTHRSGVPGSASTSRTFPLTLSLCIALAPRRPDDSEPQTVAAERHRAQPPAGGGEDGVGQGGGHGDRARLAEPSQLSPALDELGGQVGRLGQVGQLVAV